MQCDFVVSRVYMRHDLHWAVVVNLLGGSVEAAGQPSRLASGWRRQASTHNSKFKGRRSGSETNQEDKTEEVGE